MVGWSEVFIAMAALLSTRIGTVNVSFESFMKRSAKAFIVDKIFMMAME